MSDFIPKPANPGIKIGGLSRQAQKLQAMREKAAAAAAAKPGAKLSTAAPAQTFKAKSSVTRKTTFQRKAV